MWRANGAVPCAQSSRGRLLIIRVGASRRPNGPDCKWPGCLHTLPFESNWSYPTICANDEYFKLASAAADALSELYHKIGMDHL